MYILKVPLKKFSKKLVYQPFFIIYFEIYEYKANDDLRLHYDCLNTKINKI